MCFIVLDSPHAYLLNAIEQRSHGCPITAVQFQFFIILNTYATCMSIRCTKMG